MVLFNFSQFFLLSYSLNRHNSPSSDDIQIIISETQNIPNSKIHSKVNAGIAIVVSVLAHILLLLFISHSSQVAPIEKKSNKPPVIKAQLMFLQKKQPQKIVQKIAPEIKPIESELKPAEPEIKPIEKSKPKQPISEPPKVAVTEKKKTEQNSSKSAAKVEPKKADVIEKPSKYSQQKSVVAHFDPYSKIQDMLSQKNEVFFNSVSQKDQPQPSYRSINSADEPKIKAIFKTAKDLGNGTRIINYGGTCMQIKRVLDYNGFSRFNWTPSTVPCGLDSANKLQFKLSMDKFLKPKY